MKTFLIVLVLIGAVVAEEWVAKRSAEIKAMRSECLASNPLSAEQLEALNNLVYPDEEPVRKYILCMFEKWGIFSQHEGLHVERAVKQFKMKLDEAEATAIIEKCVDKNEEKSSPDVWLYRGHKCMIAGKIGDEIKEYVAKNRAKKN